MGTAFLQLKSGTGIEEHLRTIILGSSLIIGRDAAMADICISSPFISRRHAAVFEERGTWYIQDLKSKNGTFINDKRLDDKRFPLRNGDLITFSGQITYVYQSGAGPVGETQSFSFQTPAFGIQLVEDSKDVIIDGATIEPKLSPQEWEFLHILMEEPGKLYTYKEICRKLFSIDEDIFSVVVYLKPLQATKNDISKKIRRCGISRTIIKSRNGIGYQIVGNDPNS